MSEAERRAIMPAVREILLRHLPPDWHPRDRDIYDLAYLVELARSAPHNLTHGAGHHALASSIRQLMNVLPGVIEEAEAEAATAARDGRATDMDRFARAARRLQEAAAPFVAMTEQRHSNGAWHGYARAMAVTVRTIRHEGGTLSWTVRDTNIGDGVAILVELLGLIGHTVSPGTVVKALAGRSGTTFKN